jgi:murein DD-endopeptidase MepM/ murein hydrolase activator NlpD
MADSLTHQRGDAEEVFELFPAMDLYTAWDDDHVDPLIGKGKIQIPDTMDIDVSHFYAPIKGAITSPYGWRHRRMHKGTDIKLYTGDTVYAAFTGRVRIKKFDRRGYGYYLVLRHSNGLETVYGHLSRFLVNQDDLVKAGDPIALGGSTGRSTGPHLHFEMRFMGIAIDPATIINFNTFEPRSAIYKFKAKPAQLAQHGNAPASGSGALYHKVRQGDTLGKIAQRYSTTVGKICKLNQIRSTQTLRIGQRIRYR